MSGDCLFMVIRSFEAGDEDALRAIFHDAVHGIAIAQYSEQQVAAWAPPDYDRAEWSRRMAANMPFVAVIDGLPAGFADLQPSGYIDMFFVHPQHARRGVASALMHRVLRTAREAGMASVFSHVSLTAEPFFGKHGFAVEQRNRKAVRGAVLDNASMRLQLARK